MLPHTSPPAASHPSQISPDESVQKLIKYKAQRMIGKAGLTQSDIDDITQELWLDIIRRLPRFRPDRAQRNTYVSRLIDHQLATILRHRRTAMRDCRRCSSLNEPVKFGQTTERADLIDQNVHARRTGSNCQTDEDTDLASDIRAIMAKMPPQMQELCQRLITDSQSAIARDIGVPRTTLQEKIEKIRRRFENGGLRIYL